MKHLVASDKGKGLAALLLLMVHDDGKRHAKEQCDQGDAINPKTMSFSFWARVARLIYPISRMMMN